MKQEMNGGGRQRKPEQVGEGVRQAGTKERFARFWPLGSPLMRFEVDMLFRFVHVAG